MMGEELTPAEQAAEQVLTNALPHMVGLVNDALARMIVAAVRPVIESEVGSERDGFRKMMNSAVSAGVAVDGERLDALREVDRLEGVLKSVSALHQQEHYLINTIIAPPTRHFGCFTCKSDGPCATAQAVTEKEDER